MSLETRSYIPGLDPDHPISDEDRFILACSRTWVIPEEIDAHLGGNLDWEFVVQYAIYHRIAPLLYYNLSKIDGSQLPLEVMTELREAYVQARARNIMAFSEFSQVLGFFLQEGIAVTVLKGMALAETVYPNAALRPSTDIDLLIRREDLPRIDAMLLKMGYELVLDYRPGFASMFGTALHYVRKGAVPVDLHWHIIDAPCSRRLAIEELWKRARLTNVAGLDTLVLSPEDLLFHLCLHLSKESYLFLIWLVDISEVIHLHSGDIDWHEFLKRSYHYDLYPFARRALELVDQLFVPPIPSRVIEELGSHRSKSFISEALANPNIPRMKWSIVAFLMIRGIFPKMRYLLGKLLPSGESMRKLSSRKRLHVCYLSRVAFAVREVIHTIYKMLKGVR